MPDALHFTGNAEADELIAAEPLALLVGFVLDQQVTVPTAFSGPLKLKQRLGALDAAEIAQLDPDRLLEAFRQKPGVLPGAAPDVEHRADHPAGLGELDHRALRSAEVPWRRALVRGVEEAHGAHPAASRTLLLIGPRRTLGPRRYA